MGKERAAQMMEQGTGELPGHTLRLNSCNNESEFIKYLLSSQKSQQKNRKKRKQFKEKDQRIKSLGWKTGTKFMSVM